MVDNPSRFTVGFSNVNKTVLKAFILLLLLVPAFGHAEDFETDSWPGEGIPRFSSKKDVLVLYDQPSLKSSLKKTAYKKGQRIDYDKSKLVTKKSVTLTAKTEVTDMSCKNPEGLRPKIKPGEQIEYLQYRAEGYVTARYKDHICEVFIMDNIPKFSGIGKEPVVEWWIRVIGTNKKPQGWLLIDDSQVNFLDREF